MITTEMWVGRFEESELTQHYFELCKLNHNGKGQKHHILPKSLWPEYEKCKWNLVNLTDEDHYRVHEILPFICLMSDDKAKMVHAWSYMATSSAGENVVTPERYAELREIHRYSISGENHPNFGKKCDEETLLRMTDLAKKQWANPELRTKQSETIKALWQDEGYKLSVRENMKLSRADEGYRLKQSQLAKERWLNPEYATKVLEAIALNAANPVRNKKISDLAKERCKSPEYIKIMSDAGKAAWSSEEKRSKQSETIRNKHITDLEYHSRMASLNVVYVYEQYSLEGELLNTYDCAKQMTDLGFSRGCVAQVCTGKRKSHKGFFWKRRMVNT